MRTWFSQWKQELLFGQKACTNLSSFLLFSLYSLSPITEDPGSCEVANVPWVIKQRWTPPSKHPYGMNPKKFMT